MLDPTLIIIENIWQVHTGCMLGPDMYKKTQQVVTTINKLWVSRNQTGEKRFY